MAEKERYHELDILRGIAIFAMIVIHATVYFPADKTAYFFWDSMQFAVPVFLFCSVYISVKRNQIVHLAQFFSYLKKRLKRLLLPYWLFLLAYIPLVYFFEPLKMPLSQMLRLATISTVDNDLSWLVLLFVMFSFLVPLVLFLNSRHRALFWTFGLVSFLSSVLFVVLPSPVHFKLVMWLPWSLMIFFTWGFVKEERSPTKMSLLFIASAVTWASLYYYLLRHGLSVLHYDNKYPPNLFDLSYGMGSIIALYFLAKKRVFDLPYLKQGIFFLSRHSYSIFFIHFLILYVMTTYYKEVFGKLIWWQFFGVLFALTVLGQLLLEGLRRRLVSFRL